MTMPGIKTTSGFSYAAICASDALHRANVATRAEAARSRAVEDHDVDVRIVRPLREHRSQLADHFQGEGVQLRGAIQR
jgi:hypothetical protein